MSLLGIDIGSGGCKGVAFDCDGNVLARAIQNYSTYSPGAGMVEINAECFWQATATVVQKIAAAVTRDPIVALAISSHGETLIPIGRDGVAVAPAIMNSDNRSVEQVAWWRDEFGVERLYELTGLPLQALFSLNKIMWLKAYEPRLFAQCTKILSAGDYVLSRMGMPLVTDYSLACRTMAFDIHKKTWSDEILAAAGIDRKLFPEALPAGSIVGTLSDEVAASLGLSPGVIVALGGHDQPCGALGSGVVDPGQVAVSAGTYECAAAVSPQPVNTLQSFNFGLNSYCHVVPNRYITLAFFPAGIVSRWFVEQFCYEDQVAAAREKRSVYEVLNEKAMKACPEPSGICFTPHLVGSCNPYWDVRATGATVGLTPFKTRHHLYKAIHEGIACELALNTAVLEGITGKFTEMRISGGNANAEFAVQLRADMTGKKVLTLHTSEAVCQGAALLAGVAAGVYRDIDDAVTRTVCVHKTFLPDVANRLAYNRQLQQYQTLYGSLAKIRELQ